MQDTAKLHIVEGEHKPWHYQGHHHFWEWRGFRMMTLGEIYALIDSWTPAQLASLRKGLREHYLFTSQLEYSGSKVSSDGRIFVECLRYLGAPITGVAEAVLQHLLDTRDSKMTIIAKLSAFFEKEPEDIKFYTPSLTSRENNPQRVVSLCYHGGKSRIHCGDDLYYKGKRRAAILAK